MDRKFSSKGPILKVDSSFQCNLMRNNTNDSKTSQSNKYSTLIISEVRWETHDLTLIVVFCCNISLYIHIYVHLSNINVSLFFQCK